LGLDSSSGSHCCGRSICNDHSDDDDQSSSSSDLSFGKKLNSKSDEEEQQVGENLCDEDNYSLDSDEDGGIQLHKKSRHNNIEANVYQSSSTNHNSKVLD